MVWVTEQFQGHALTCETFHTFYLKSIEYFHLQKNKIILVILYSGAPFTYLVTKINVTHLLVLFLSPLQHMDSMGENLERLNLLLKLFKLVFGSVTLFAQENELMLKVC